MSGGFEEMKHADSLTTVMGNRQPVRPASGNARVKSGSAQSFAAIPFLQRKPFCACDGGCPRCSGTEPGLDSQIRSMRGVGQPLSKTERNYFEPRFGRDFSNVRIHTGGKAAEAAASVNAKAFTVGRDIVFGSGQYSPGTSSGKHLLAHELTHTIQQGRRGLMKLQRKPLPCRRKHKTAVDSARKNALKWIYAARKWLNSYINTINVRANRAKRLHSHKYPIGSAIYEKMKKLQKHFDIFSGTPFRGRSLSEISGGYWAKVDEFTRFGNTAWSIRSRYDSLLNIHCINVYCRPGTRKSVRGRGRKAAADAGDTPGLGIFTINTGSFTNKPLTSRTAIFLHEAFHAENYDFINDSYIGDSNYPGDSPLTNAESYMAFAYMAEFGNEMPRRIPLRLKSMKLTAPRPKTPKP